MSLLAAALVVATVLVWRPPWSWVRVRIMGIRPWRPSRRALPAVAGVLAGASLIALPPAPTTIAWMSLAVAATAWHRVRRARERRAESRRAEQAQLVIDLLVTELRSGALPASAVERLADEVDGMSQVAAAAASGGDIGAALVAAGRRPGASALATIGHAWAVSEACGAPLTSVLEQVRETAREDRELQRELMSGVAPARATATMMVAMPPLGLALGAGLGVDPVSVVLTTLPGSLCVSAGVGFAIAGVLWIDRIADRATATG